MSLVINGAHTLDGLRVVTPLRLQGAPRIEPTMIVLHDTAGALRPFSSVEWFCSPECTTSAHIVVERDGTITQLLPFDRKAAHAGESSWNGRRYCNGFSVGIEIVNPGRLVDNRDGTASPAFDRRTRWTVDGAQVVEADSPHHKRGLWLAYTQQQVEAVQAIIDALCRRYPITALVGHHDICEPKGRKEDPTPLMDWQAMRRPFEARASVRAPIPGGPDLVAVQSRLAELGYALGAADGHWGPRTRSAVRDFQEQAGLPVTGDLDERTRAAIMHDAAPEQVTGSRDEWTPADLRRAGSTQATLGLFARVKAWFLAALGLGTFAGAAGDAAPGVDAGQAIGLIDRTLPAIERIVLSRFGAIALGLVVIAGAVYWLGNRIEANRLRAAQRGEHLGI